MPMSLNKVKMMYVPGPTRINYKMSEKLTFIVLSYWESRTASYLSFIVLICNFKHSNIFFRKYGLFTFYIRFFGEMGQNIVGNKNTKVRMEILMSGKQKFKGNNTNI